MVDNQDKIGTEMGKQFDAGHLMSFFEHINPDGSLKGLISNAFGEMMGKLTGGGGGGFGGIINGARNFF